MPPQNSPATAQQSVLPAAVHVRPAQQSPSPPHGSLPMAQHSVLPAAEQVRGAQQVASSPVQVAPPVRQGAHSFAVIPDPPALQTPPQQGGAPPMQIASCGVHTSERHKPSIHNPEQHGGRSGSVQESPVSVHEPGTWHVPAPQKPEQHWPSVAHATPKFPHDAGRQMPSPQRPEQHSALAEHALRLFVQAIWAQTPSRHDPEQHCAPPPCVAAQAAPTALQVHLRTCLPLPFVKVSMAPWQHFSQPSFLARLPRAFLAGHLLPEGMHASIVVFGLWRSPRDGFRLLARRFGLASVSPFTPIAASIATPTVPPISERRDSIPASCRTIPSNLRGSTLPPSFT
jgi:hypothetical protein